MKDKNKNGTSAQFNAPPQAYVQQGAQPYAQQQFAQPQQSAQPNYSAPQPDYRVQPQPAYAANAASSARCRPTPRSRYARTRSQA